MVVALFIYLKIPSNSSSSPDGEDARCPVHDSIQETYMDPDLESRGFARNVQVLSTNPYLSTGGTIFVSMY